MKNVNRVVSTSLWDDDLVLDKFSAEDKYFMLYILTNKFTSQLGIYHFPIKKVAPDMGYSVETIYSLIDRFENRYGVIAFSQATNEIAILNYLRHSVIKGGKPVYDCLINDYENVKDKSLVSLVINHLSNYELKNDTVIQFINYVKEKDNKNDNNNDNDNDSIVDVSLTSRPRIVEEIHKSKEKPTKNKYGKYGNVLLTETEFERLAEDYGIEKRDKAIDYLDMYIPDKEYKSKSHNMAIRRWVIDAIEREKYFSPKTKGQTQIRETQDALARFLANRGDE